MTFCTIPFLIELLNNNNNKNKKDGRDFDAK
jgi:hypothetical protein